MILGIYGLWDRKAGKYLSTFTETNVDTAKRNFKMIRTDKNTIIGNFPEDYELWELGKLDAEIGIISNEKKLVEGGAVIVNE